MSNQTIEIMNGLKSQLNEARMNGLTTSKVRTIASTFFKRIDNKQIDHVLCLCEILLNERKWELGVIAYDWAFRMNKDYTRDTFFIFERWLKDYVRGWGDCDDFCTHALGALLSEYNDLFEYTTQWTKHEDFWVRRAAAVILIYPMNKNKFQGIDPFLISDQLLNDAHDLVLKGYGWMLKVLSKTQPMAVFDYLIEKKHVMPRVSYRYAVEKFDKDKRAYLMAL